MISQDRRVCWWPPYHLVALYHRNRALWQNSWYVEHCDQSKVRNCWAIAFNFLYKKCLGHHWKLFLFQHSLQLKDNFWKCFFHCSLFIAVQPGFKLLVFFVTAKLGFIPHVWCLILESHKESRAAIPAYFFGLFLSRHAHACVAGAFSLIAYLPAQGIKAWDRHTYSPCIS